MFKSIGKLIFGDSKNLELIQISSGQLYLVTPKGSKIVRECLYKDAQATIRRTETEFQYQLVVSRVFEEGEEELEDEAEIDDGKSFLIDEVLQFRRGEFEGEDLFSWVDPFKNGVERYEFVPDLRTTLYTSKTFEQTMYHCMYERKYRRTHQDATDDDLLELQYDTKGSPKKPSAATPPGTPMSITNTPVKTQYKKLGPSTGTADYAAINSPLKDKSSRPAVQDLPTLQELVTSVAAELHLFDSVKGQFLLQANDVKAELVRVGTYKYWLAVSGSDQAYLGQPVEPKMNPVFNNEHKSFIWNYYDDLGVYSWLLRFLDDKSEDDFKNAFGLCMYETLNQQVFSKQKKDDQDYVINAYQEDIEMGEASETDEDEGEGEEDEDESEYEDEINTEAADKSKNSQLAVGYKHDRSFVVRGNKIGVFKHTDDERLEFATTINDVKTMQGREFSPRKVMLHEEDSSMLLMDPNNEHSVYRMDLEYGKVVEEWKVHDIIPVSNIIPDSKYAQMTQQKTLVGMSHNSLFRIDPRLGGFKLVDDQRKQYTTKNDFSAAATTEKGAIAVASNKGDIRLFDKVGKNAKTALPALGDPIIGIDVTADGRWVLATCKTYLLLIDTEIKDGEHRLGFEKSFPKDQKPVPKRLQLRPEHVAYMGQAVSFTAARFNTGANENEKTIVTSTGPYVITWNFRRVKQGRMNDYQIKRYADDVVADNFKFGQDRAIVVALPHDGESTSLPLSSFVLLLVPSHPLTADR